MNSIGILSQENGKSKQEMLKKLEKNYWKYLINILTKLKISKMQEKQFGILMKKMNRKLLKLAICLALLFLLMIRIIKSLL